MIAKPTVLVLGAGASCTYGFHLGLQLKARICKALRSNGTLIAAILKGGNGKTPDDIERFHRDLILSGDASIDAFLEHRTEYLEMGKLAIAAVLLPLERHSALFDDWIDKWDDPTNTERHWYQVLFRKLRSDADPEKFKKTGLRIVTFNCDRSLEYYLQNCIKAAYGSEQGDLLKSIPIVHHIYGKLGDLDEVPYGKWATANEPERLDLLERAANKISIIHEPSVANVGFEKAKELMEGADRVCVLGFGFDLTNVGRLFPPSLRSIKIGGTTYGISDQMYPRLYQHGLGGFGSEHQRKQHWPSIAIYEWLSNYPEGAIDQ